MCLKIVFILGKGTGPGWLDAYGSCVCCGAGDGRCQAGSNGERVLRDRLRQTVFPFMKETQSFRRLTNYYLWGRSFHKMKLLRDFWPW